MCPACEQPLVLFELEGVEIDHCLSCRGSWLDAGELEAIALLAGALPGDLSRALAEREGEKHGSRRCVRCPARLRVGPVRGVEIDRCPHGHGLWFDQREMSRLLGAFEKEPEGGAVARFFREMFRAELESEGKKGG